MRYLQVSFCSSEAPAFSGGEEKGVRGLNVDRGGGKLNAMSRLSLSVSKKKFN